MTCHQTRDVFHTRNFCGTFITHFVFLAQLSANKREMKYRRAAGDNNMKNNSLKLLIISKHFHFLFCVITSATSTHSSHEEHKINTQSEGHI